MAFAAYIVSLNSPNLHFENHSRIIGWAKSSKQFFFFSKLCTHSVFFGLKEIYTYQVLISSIFVVALAVKCNPVVLKLNFLGPNKSPSPTKRQSAVLPAPTPKALSPPPPQQITPAKKEENNNERKISNEIPKTSSSPR